MALRGGCYPPRRSLAEGAGRTDRQGRDARRPSAFEGPSLVVWREKRQAFHQLPKNVPAYPKMLRRQGKRGTALMSIAQGMAERQKP
jgi:hypothetical protein